MYDAYKNELRRVFAIAAGIFDRRMDDYGPDNITQSGLRGIEVRMRDKLNRLRHLLTNREDPRGESIVDTLLDIANYAAIAVMVENGTWNLLDHSYVLRKIDIEDQFFPVVMGTDDLAGGIIAMIQHSPCVLYARVGGDEQPLVASYENGVFSVGETTTSNVDEAIRLAAATVTLNNLGGESGA